MRKSRFTRQMVKILREARGAPRYLRAEGVQNGSDESFKRPLPRGVSQRGVVPNAEVAAAIIETCGGTRTRVDPTQVSAIDTHRVQSEGRGNAQADRSGVFLASIGPRTQAGQAHEDRAIETARYAGATRGRTGRATCA